MYKIGAIAKATGLSVHNLRIWESRYGAIEVDRTESGRRLYSEQDLKRLQLLKQCVQNGMAISSIAACKNEKLHQLLAEVGSTGAAPQQTQRGWQLCLVGSDARQLIQPALNHQGYNFTTEHHASIDALWSNHRGESIDILFFDLPSLTQADAQQIGQKIKTLQARNAIIAYRYARQQDVAYLKSLGIRLVKVPLDAQYINTLFEQLLQTQKPTTSLLPAQAPSRRFNDQQLNKAAQISSSIECECPQHMAEIIKGLTAFEAYSAQCKSTDKSSRDLHHHIFLKTAEARAIMESLMQSVLDQEGINLEIL